jgi:hypothetical protein
MSYFLRALLPIMLPGGCFVTTAAWLLTALARSTIMRTAAVSFSSVSLRSTTANAASLLVPAPPSSSGKTSSRRAWSCSF